MNRIKIVQEGWAGFTGNIGQVEFVDGVSTDSWNNVYIDRVACSVSVVDADTDEPLGMAERMIAAQTVRMEVAEPTAAATEADVNGKKAKKGAKEAPVEPVVVEQVFHTGEELEAIADTKGIAGLRLIGTPLGVRGRGIPELISDILRAEAAIKERQAALNPPAAPVEEPAADEATDEEAPADELPEEAPADETPADEAKEA